MEVLISLSAKSLGDLYHSTSLNSFLKMIKSGMFGLTTGRAQTNEQGLQAGYSFFGSFTRSRNGGYHRDKSNCVMLTFDGTRLSNTYKFAPVDTGVDISETKELKQKKDCCQISPSFLF